MPGQRIPEMTVRLIKSQIQTNIAAVLASISAEITETYQMRTQFSVPKDYLFGEAPPSKTFQCPAVFIIVPDVDFKLERGQNYINANVSVNLTCVIEAADSDELALMSYRYFGALHEVLDGAHIVSSNGDIKLVVKVINGSFTPVYTAEEAKATSMDFRKECLLNLEVNHWEQT